MDPTTQLSPAQVVVAVASMVVGMCAGVVCMRRMCRRRWMGAGAGVGEGAAAAATAEAASSEARAAGGKFVRVEGHAPPRSERVEAPASPRENGGGVDVEMARLAPTPSSTAGAATATATQTPQQQPWQQQQPAAVAAAAAAAAPPQHQKPLKPLRGSTDVRAPNLGWQSSADAAAAAFEPSPTLAASEFESGWNRAQVVDVWGETLARVPLGATVLPYMQRLRFATVATGTVSGVEKAYFCARAGSVLAMLELSLDLATHRLSVVFKSTSTPSTPERARDHALFAAFKKMVEAVFV